jgi:hypothetical protein
MVKAIALARGFTHDISTGGFDLGNIEMCTTERFSPFGIGWVTHDESGVVSI